MARGIPTSIVFVLAALAIALGATGAYRVLFATREASRRREIIECALGDIAPGKAVDGRVRIPNSGSNALTVKRITKDCGCISVDLSRGKIDPGEYTELSFQYAAPNRGGPIEHILEIAYDEVPMRTCVHVTGTIVSWASIDGDKVDFGDVYVGDKATRDLLVKAVEPWPKDEREAQFLLEHGGISNAELDSGPCNGSVATWRLEFEPPLSAAGKRFSGEVVLRWKGRPQHVLRVPCLAHAVTRCRADPHSAFFGLVAGGVAKQVDIRVCSRDPKSCGELREPQLMCDLGPAFNVSCAMVDSYSVDVSIRLSTDRAGATGLQRGRVDVVDEKNELLVSIPVFAMLEE